MSRTRHVIVAHPWKIAFARVPKVATISVRSLFARNLQLSHPTLVVRNDVFWIEADPDKAGLVSPRQYVTSFSDYWCFTVTREPFSRLLSCYNNKIIRLETIPRDFLAMGCRKGMTFSEFADIVAVTPDEGVDIHLIPQASLLTYENKAYPDFVARLETIGDDWTVIRDEIKARSGLDLGPLPHRNKRHEDALSFDDAVAHQPGAFDAVYERYRRDYELFYPHISSIDDLRR